MVSILATTWDAGSCVSSFPASGRQPCRCPHLDFGAAHAGKLLPDVFQVRLGLDKRRSHNVHLEIHRRLKIRPVLGGQNRQVELHSQQVAALPRLQFRIIEDLRLGFSGRDLQGQPRVKAAPARTHKAHLCDVRI